MTVQGISVLPMHQKVDGQTKQKRRLTSRRRLTAGLEMGGPGIPQLDETSRVFQQNLIEKRYKQGSINPPANLPSILLGLLDRENQPTYYTSKTYLMSRAATMAAHG
jgi:hypothetical protein